jgi:hypothetical protein
VSGVTEAQPCVYKGTHFRSTLEANWAATLNHYGIKWEYEPEYHVLDSGTQYLPDFVLPELRTVIEAKGPHNERIAKPAELAAENPGVIVIIGYPPVNRSLQPMLWDPYIQFRDAAGYDTRLAQCPECKAWQWLRAQISRRCRKCHALHTGVLAKSSELPFVFAEPDRPSWLGRL